MNTIFRKVSVKERLPNRPDMFIVISDLGQVSQSYFSHDYQKFEKQDCVFWFEEIALPTDEKIKTMTMEYDFSNELIFKAFYRGAQRMRDFVLAVTAKDNVR